jgi:hypothetical protein
MRSVPSPLLGVTCALLLSTTLLAQTPTWTVEFVGSAPPDWSGGIAAIGVNDAGQVLGNTTVDLVARPWVGSPGEGFELLPLPPGVTWSRADEINDAGLVVGQVLLSTGSRAAVWQPGPGGYTVTLLPAGADGALPFDARGVNDRGDVVGKYGVLSGSYLWNADTGTTRLDGFPVFPEAINNARQVLGDTWRMDVDTMVPESLGVPTGTGYNYMFADYTLINDAGECAGYGNVATGQSSSKLAVRFTDGVGWKVFNAFPMVSANVIGLAASGDATFQLGVYGMWVYVQDVGSFTLQGALDPASAHWDLSGSFAPFMSRAGRLACNGLDTVSGQAGIVLLTPAGFTDLGGGAPGALGTPILGGYGVTAPGESVRVRLSAAAPGNLAWFVISSASSPVPKLGGLLHANPPELFQPIATDALGRVDETFDWPAAPVGSEVYLQAAVVDGEAEPPYSFSLSNALQAVTR